MKVKPILITLISTVVFMMATNGISTSADENLKVYDDVVHDVTPKAKVIYPEESFRFATVGVPQNTSNSKVSLESYLLQEIRNFNEDFIDVYSYNVSVEDLKNTFSKILCENSDVFYLSEEYGYAQDENENVVGVQFNYKIDEGEYDDYKALIDEKFSPIFNSINDSMSDYEKVLLVHDYLCTNFSYDLTYSVYNLIDFIKYDTGVCQAYYQAFNYILTEIGIECYPVQSELLNHIWAMVKLGDEYYQVDATWDDYTPDLLGWSSHANFLMDDAATSEKHNVNGVVDWYLYEDGISAEDSSFSDYAFKTQNNPFTAIGSDICYIDDGVLCKYDLSSNVSTPLNEISPEHKWYNLNASIKQYYRQTFYSINTYKDIFLVNTSTDIYVLNDDYQIIDVLYTHEDTTKTLIYGMTIKDGNVLIQLESNPNAGSDNFGTNIVSVCNMEEYYQRYSANKDSFTTYQPTVVTTTVSTTPTVTTTTSTSTANSTTSNSTITSTTTTTTTTTTATTTTGDNPPDTNTSPYDVNGDNAISMLDLLALKTYILDGETFNPNYTYDVNSDGKIDTIDMMTLKEGLLLDS